MKINKKIKLRKWYEGAIDKIFTMVEQETGIKVNPEIAKARLKELGL